MGVRIRVFVYFESLAAGTPRTQSSESRPTRTVRRNVPSSIATNRSDYFMRTQVGESTVFSTLPILDVSLDGRETWRSGLAFDSRYSRTAEVPGDVAKHFHLV